MYQQSSDASETLSQAELETYRIPFGSVGQARVYLSIKENYRLLFYKPVVRMDLQQRKITILIITIKVLMTIMIITY